MQTNSEHDEDSDESVWMSMSSVTRTELPLLGGLVVVVEEVSMNAGLGWARAGQLDSGMCRVMEMLFKLCLRLLGC